MAEQGSEVTVWVPALLRDHTAQRQRAPDGGARVWRSHETFNPRDFGAAIVADQYVDG